SSIELARAFGFVHSTVDVPAGVAGAIERQCGDSGMPALGLWAQVPHYAAAMPYPAAGAALVEGLSLVAGLSLDAGPLHGAAATTRARLDALIEQNAEHQALVRQLEEQVDAASAAEPDAGETGFRLSGDSYPPGMQVPSGDELAAELERFLREQGRGQGET
ncbi:MAG: PAC2 family protein, partial [Actinomycetota bacterium]